MLLRSYDADAGLSPVGREVCAGMIVTARDIVTRLPEADAKRVRLELAGNLCRCTGYAGIVRAILAVLEKRKANS